MSWVDPGIMWIFLGAYRSIQKWFRFRPELIEYPGVGKLVLKLMEYPGV
jgi:hypothetical protein